MRSRTVTRLLPALVVSLLLVACGGAEAEPIDLIVVTPEGATPAPGSRAPSAVTASPTAEVTATTPLPGQPAILDAAIPRPFGWPIEGGCLPTSDLLMPNAPRQYRNGVHEGLDFYNGSSCAHVERGTPVLAMYEGTVVRADLDYRDLTPQQVNDLAALTARQGYTDDQTLDIYRGRQVWIDHGNGVVTRYCHLSAITPGIRVGTVVRKGQQVGAVGESGTPESVTAPGTEMHLHAEVRVGNSFLGAGLSPAAVRELYSQLFGVD